MSAFARSRLAPGHPSELHAEILELPEFYVLKPIEYVPNSDLRALVGVIVSSAPGGGGGGTNTFGTTSTSSSGGTAKAAIATDEYTPGTAMINRNRFANEVTLVRDKNNPSVTYTVAGLPPLDPLMFESVRILGKREERRRNIQINACYYEIKNWPSASALAGAAESSSEGANHPRFSSFRRLCQGIFTHHKSHDETFLTSLAKFLWPFHEKAHTVFAEQHLQQGEQQALELDATLSVDPMSVFEFMVTGVAKEACDMFYRNHHTKMMLYTSEWNLLSRYYPYDILGAGMSLEAFQDLHLQMTGGSSVGPIAFCYNKRSHITYDVVVKLERDERVFIKRHLPELDMEHLVDVGSHTNLSVLPQEIAMLCIYQALKNAYVKDKHSYVELSALRQRTLDYWQTVLKHLHPFTVATVSDILGSSALGTWWYDLLKKLHELKVIKCADRFVYGEASANMPTTIQGTSCVYLFTRWAYEQIVAEACSIVGENCASAAASGGSRIKLAVPVSSLKTNGGHALCPEQAAAVESVLNNPVTIVSGPAGSGKSDFLQCLSKFVDLKPDEQMDTLMELLISINPHKKRKDHEAEAKKMIEADRLRGGKMSWLAILYTSLQSNNVSDLNKLAGAGRAFTMHSLLLRHQLRCPNFGVKQRCGSLDPMHGTTSSSGTTSGTSSTLESYYEETCLFKNFRMVIIEEASLATDEGIALVLGALVMCAPNLERLVIIGDHNQCAAVSGGNVLRDLTRAFNTFKQVVYFTHDHRSLATGVAGGKSLLKINSEAILERNYEKMRFDGKQTVLVEVPTHFPPAAGNLFGERAMIAPELEALVKKLVKEHQLSPYNSHMITHLNKYVDQINDTLRRLYFEMMYPHMAAQYKPWSLYKGAKVLFNRGVLGGGSAGSTIVSNRVYIIAGVFDMDVDSILRKRRVDKYFKKSDTTGGTTKIVLNGGTGFTGNKKRKLEEQLEEDGDDAAAPAEEDRTLYGPKQIEEMTFVDEASKLAGGSTWRGSVVRYVVLYEMSQFGSKINDDKRYAEHKHLDTFDKRLDHEWQRLKKNIAAGTLPNVIAPAANYGLLQPSHKKEKGGEKQKPSHPLVVDTEEIFTVCQWNQQEMFHSVRSAFATTVHKFQGSQIDKVVFWLLSSYDHDTIEIFYTAETRGRYQVITVGAPENIQRSLLHSEPHRNTRLEGELVAAVRAQKKKAAASDSAQVQQVPRQV